MAGTVSMNRLPQEDLIEGTARALGILHYAGLISEATLDYVLVKNGKLLCDAIIFLSQGDKMEALLVLKNIVSCISDCDIRTRKAINTVLTGRVYVDICKPNLFSTMATIAIKELLLSFKATQAMEDILMEIVYSILQNIKPSSPLAVHHVEMLYVILKCVRIDNLHGDKLILELIALCIVRTPLHAVAKSAKKLAEFLINNMRFSIRHLWYRTLTDYSYWHDFHCQVAVCLLKTWPVNESLPNITALLRLMHCCLNENQNKNVILRIMKIIIPYVDVATWREHFIEPLLQSISQDQDTARTFMRSTLLECITLSVREYGSILFEHDFPKAKTIHYAALLLYSGVKERCVMVNEYQDIINKMSSHPDEFVQYYAIKSVCTIIQRNMEVTKSHLDQFLLFLQNMTFSSHDFYPPEFNYFLSHICFRSNVIIMSSGAATEQNLTDLRVYEDFLVELYDFCMTNMMSRDARRVAIGAKVFGQIVKIFTGSSETLETKYSIQEKYRYEKHKAPFLKYLTKKNKWPAENHTYKILFEEFLNSEKVFQEIPTLLKQLSFSRVSLWDKQIFHLHNIISLISDNADFELVEKCRQMMPLLLYRGNAPEAAGEFFQTIFKKWKTIGDELTWTNADKLYGFTMCLHNILESQYVPSSCLNMSTIFQPCIEMIIKLLDLYGDYGNTNVTANVVITNRQIKSTEHAIVALLEMIHNIVVTRKHVCYTNPALQVANAVIQAGAGKRPVVNAAAAIRHICSEILKPLNYESDETLQQVAIVTKFLEERLDSIYATPEQQSSKMRRNPEHRLIIHSIVAADQRLNHPFLIRVMNFLLDVLSSPSTTSYSKAAALHTVEALVTDSNMNSATFPYIAVITCHCITEFSRDNWTLKNAAIQVLQATLSRIFGQKYTSTNTRRSTIDEVFILYPVLEKYFYSELQNYSHGNYDTKITILAIFAESHRKSDLFSTKNMKSTISCFMDVFIKLILSENGTVGLFAAKAYTAMYPHKRIHLMVPDIVKGLETHFHSISNNTFHTFVCLLTALYDKFNSAPDVPYYKSGICKIHSAFQTLLLFVEQLNYKFEFNVFSMLGIISNRLDIVEKAVLRHLEEERYHSRLWLRKNVPYVLHNINAVKFPNFLKSCSSYSLSMYSQMLYLDGILDRFKELNKHSLTESVLTVVLDNFLQMTDPRVHLTYKCSYVILLLFNSCDFKVEDSVTMRLRGSYGNVDQTSIYVLGIYIALLSKFEDFSPDDQVFIECVIPIYHKCALCDDVQIQQYVAVTLEYLYKCAKVSDRHRVLKVAFILLLTKEAARHICKFISVAYKLDISNVYLSLQNLISLENLTEQLENLVSVADFLVEIFLFISMLSDSFEDCEEFYMKQSIDACSHKYSVKEMLYDKLKISMNMLPQEDREMLLCKAKLALDLFPREDRGKILRDIESVLSV